MNEVLSTPIDTNTDDDNNATPIDPQQVLISNIANNLPEDISARDASIILALSQDLTGAEVARIHDVDPATVSRVKCQHLDAVKALSQVRDHLAGYIAGKAAYVLAQRGFEAATALKIDPGKLTPHNISSIATAAKTFSELAKSLAEPATPSNAQTSDKSLQYKEMQKIAESGIDALKEIDKADQ